MSKPRLSAKSATLQRSFKVSEAEWDAFVAAAELVGKDRSEIIREQLAAYVRRVAAMQRARKRA
jgi:hypothetical protein